jgi:hypothetical protein
MKIFYFIDARLFSVLLLLLPPRVRFLKFVQLVTPGKPHSLWELT